MILPAVVLAVRYRRGRPRRDVDMGIVDILLAHRLPTRRIAAALGVTHPTILSRLKEAHHRPPLFRCPTCDSLATTGRCPNGHEINSGFSYQT